MNTWTKVHGFKLYIEREKDNWCNYSSYEPRDLTNKEKSVVVEKVLLRIELPTLYVKGTIKGKREVILHGEYLETLTGFIGGEFRLEGLKYIPELEGIEYKNLEDRDKRIIGDSCFNVFEIVDYEITNEELKTYLKG